MTETTGAGEFPTPPSTTTSSDAPPPDQEQTPAEATDPRPPRRPSRRATPQTDPSSSPSSVAVGDVVRLAPNEDDPDAADRHVLVVGTVEGTDHRPAGALVIALPEARWVALDELASN